MQQFKLTQAPHSPIGSLFTALSLSLPCSLSQRGPLRAPATCFSLYLLLNNTHARSLSPSCINPTKDQTLFSLLAVSLPKDHRHFSIIPTQERDQARGKN